MSWVDELTPSERDDWDRFVAHHREHTLKSMEGSAFVCQLVPGPDGFDIKFAVELGMAILLGKPILAVVMPGMKPPGKLALVADGIVYADIDTEEGRQEIVEAIAAMKT